jgi:hypothetical protein
MKLLTKLHTFHSIVGLRHRVFGWLGQISSRDIDQLLCPHVIQ